MINTWNLAWIVPLAYAFGFCWGAMFKTGKEADE